MLFHVAFIFMMVSTPNTNSAKATKYLAYFTIILLIKCHAREVKGFYHLQQCDLLGLELQCVIYVLYVYV